MSADHGYPRERVEFYDERLARADRDDIDYYVDRATSADGPVLEVACGSGRIYLELLRAGVDADGIDLSADALAVLREKADDAGLEPTVRRADMKEFSADREYDLAICPFNALQHMHTVEDQLAALESIYDSLAQGGVFAFDVFVPDFDHVCETFGEWQTQTVEFRGEPHEYRNRSRLVDTVNQIMEVENELYDADGEQVFTESHRMSILPKQQVQLLADLSSFETWTVHGDFTDERLEEDHRAQNWTLQKGD